jgi:leader peptidase (prepilin peptidase)/N-methyltransferase
VTDLFARVYAFLLGAVIGSFLNVCISRWPAGESVVRPRSRCPRCGRQIRWYENVPVISWLALRAKCAGCGQPISVVYPLVETTTALIWLACVVQFGPTVTAGRLAIFSTILLGIALTDAEHYLIPDGFTVTGLMVALLGSVVALFANDPGPFALPFEAIIGACAGAGAIAIAGWLGELAFKKEAMGFGDVTLMAMVGAHLGAQRALMTIFIGAFLGAAGFLCLVYPVAWIRSRRSGGEFDPPLVPFGVFLAPGAVIALLWGERLVLWYLRTVAGA